jgi:hypothetical protein
MARRHLWVENAEPGVYLVRWQGDPTEIKSITFRALDAGGEARQTRTVSQAPFRTLLRVPQDASAVVVSIQNHDGGSVVIRLPIREFRSLERRGSEEPR